MKDNDNMIERLKNPFDRTWFTCFCTNEEAIKIENPKTPEDELLRKRASIVADSTRYLKNFLALRQFIPDYSFSKCFNTLHYKKVLKQLNDEDRQKCKEIIYGDMFINDVNGEAWLGEKGNKFISIYTGLFYYLKFCNLAFLPFDDEVPQYVRYHAAKIATRIHLKSETMDFLVDPRGIIPDSINKKINELVQLELQFIAGHEFAHHLCNHLNEKNIKKKMIFDLENEQYFEPIFNIDQKQEFEADLNSIERPNYSDDEYENLLRASLIFFKTLSFSEAIDDVVTPSDGQYKTHPTGKQRYDYLIKNISRKPKHFNQDEIIHVEKVSKIIEKCIIDDINTDFEDYETYGSFYLDKPNTKWRGKQNTDPYWGS